VKKNSPDLIRITDLLREREELFVRIHDCESTIERILGQPYPGLRPLPLPSLTKRKKPGASKTGEKRPTTLRKLRNGEEEIYIVSYEQNGNIAQSVQRETALLQLLLDSPPPEFQIRKIETARIAEDGTTRVVQTVHEISDPFSVSS
jgi:hypothetical protein